MKLTLVLSISLIFLRALHAQSSYQREFDLLTQERDRVIADAAEAANRKYAASLEGLLNRATQGKDLQTAVRVSDAIDRIAVIGSWTTKFSSGFYARIDIKPDGTLSASNRVTGTWKIQNRRLMLTYAGTGNQEYLDLPVINNKMTGKTVGRGDVAIAATRIPK